MNTVERLARMTQQEREQFVEQLVTEWPDLADTVHTQIGYALLDKESKYLEYTAQ